MARRKAVGWHFAVCRHESSDAGWLRWQADGITHDRWSAAAAAAVDF